MAVPALEDGGLGALAGLAALLGGGTDAGPAAECGRQSEREDHAGSAHESSYQRAAPPEVRSAVPGRCIIWIRPCAAGP